MKINGKTIEVKQSRPWGYPLISLIYVLAAFIGVVVYLTLPFPLLANLAIANICAAAVIYMFSLWFENCSVFDMFIGLAANVMVTGFAFWHKISFMNAAFMFIIAMWSVRYVSNWAYNFRGLGKDREKNILLREKMGSYFPIVSLLMVYLIPAILSYACVFPVVMAIENDGKMTVGTFIFLFIALLALGFEGYADIEMHRFQVKRTGGFNRKGLWSISRHPNYLGEMVFWWAIAMAACFTVGFRWYFFIGSHFNVLYFIFVRVYIAEMPLRRREGWEEYSKEIAMFLTLRPLFNRKPVEEPVVEEPKSDLVVLDAGMISEITEALEQPDVPLADIDFVMDNDEELDEGVEVIGIVWPERSRRNKVYRYDPNGEKLNAGDIVLVPSRDVAKGRDIVRKVTVAHGNYRVAPETLGRSLKKIVAVVRRAEDVE